jgi:hypothetical protein
LKQLQTSPSLEFTSNSWQLSIDIDSNKNLFPSSLLRENV